MLGIYIFLFFSFSWYSAVVFTITYRVREKELTIIIVQTKNKTRGGWAETRRMGSLLSDLALEKLMENQLKQVAVFSKVSNWLIGRRRYVPKNILTMLRWIVVSPRWSTSLRSTDWHTTSLFKNYLDSQSRINITSQPSLMCSDWSQI